MGEDLNPGPDPAVETVHEGSALNESALNDPAQKVPAPMELFRALSEFGCANLLMRQQLAGDLGMGVTDTQAIQTVLSAQSCGTPVTAAYLAHELRITTASTTKLLNRLTSAGYLHKTPNEHDARSVLITATPSAQGAFIANLTTLHGQMVDLVDTYTPQEQQIIQGFVEKMTKVYNPDGLGKGQPLFKG